MCACAGSRRVFESLAISLSRGGGEFDQSGQIYKESV
jgi:hypothetical protein